MSSSPFSPLDSLLDLACRDGVDIRPTLLRVITDLYVQKPIHSAEEEKQYVELALGLIDTVDEATRATVADRLSKYPNAPQVVLRKLEGSAVSTDSEGLPAGQAGQPEADPIEDFFSATAEERRLILINLAPVASVIPKPVPPHIIDRLESAALKRNTREFTSLLEHVLGVSGPLAVRIVEDASGEPIVVAAKALGMKAAVLQRILLVLNPTIGQSVERVFNLALLYDETSDAAAAHMVSVWRTSSTARKARHLPVYADDERGRTTARAAATLRPAQSGRPSHGSRTAGAHRRTAGQVAT